MKFVRHFEQIGARGLIAEFMAGLMLLDGVEDCRVIQGMPQNRQLPVV